MNAINDPKSADIHPLIAQRWSPRSYTGQALSPREVALILEAGRLAPSSYNVQPWRFLVSIQGDSLWGKMVSILWPFNQDWAKNAGALVLIASDQYLAPDYADGKTDSPAPTHSFDAGAAWAMMALQAHHMGLGARAMSGIFADQAREKFTIPDAFHINMVMAIGHPGSVDLLPDHLQDKEGPQTRRPIEDSLLKPIGLE